MALTDTDATASRFVMVEWDDGTGHRTQWYLGMLTKYNEKKVPLEFQDLGVDAYPGESFNIRSHLMHHYMTLKDGDKIRGKQRKADGYGEEELFTVSIPDDNTIKLCQADGTEFDFDSKPLLIIGVKSHPFVLAQFGNPLEKDQSRLIEGPGSVDLNEPEHDEDEREEAFKIELPKKHKLDINDENDSDGTAPHRKRRRITRSSNDERDEEDEDDNDESSSNEEEEEDDDDDDDDDEDEDEDDEEEDSDLDFEGDTLMTTTESISSRNKRMRRRTDRTDTATSTATSSNTHKSRSPTSMSSQSKSLSPPFERQDSDKAPKVRKGRTRNRKISCKGIEGMKLAERLVRKIRKKQLVPMAMPAVNTSVYTDISGNMSAFTTFSSQPDTAMESISTHNVPATLPATATNANTVGVGSIANTSSYGGGYTLKRRAKKKKSLIYETKYQSPFTVKMNDQVWFRSNFAFDTLRRDEEMKMQCQLLATGDVILAHHGRFKVGGGKQKKKKYVNLYALQIDRNVSLQINHDYTQKHWMSIHYNNGARFMLGHSESIRVSEWHRNISETQYSLYPDHEFIDKHNKLWQIGEPLQQVLIGDMWIIHIPKILNEKTMIVINAKNPRILPYSQSSVAEHGQQATKLSCMMWLQLISLDAFLSCTKNVVSCKQLCQITSLSKQQRANIWHEMNQQKFREQMCDIKELYTLECSAQFLVKYGKKIDIDSKVWSDSEMLDFLSTDQLAAGSAGSPQHDKYHPFNCYSNLVVLDDAFSYDLHEIQNRNKKKTKQQELKQKEESTETQQQQSAEKSVSTTSTTEDSKEGNAQNEIEAQTKLNDTTVSMSEMTAIERRVINTTDYDVRHYDVWLANLSDLRWRELTEVCRYLNVKVAGNTSVLKGRITKWVRNAQQTEANEIARIKQKYHNVIDAAPRPAISLEIDSNTTQGSPTKSEQKQKAKGESVGSMKEENDADSDEDREQEPFYRLKSLLKHIGFQHKLNNLKLGSILLLIARDANSAKPVFLEGIIYEMHIHGTNASLECNVIISKISANFLDSQLPTNKCKIIPSNSDEDAMLFLELDVNRWHCYVFNNVLKEYYEENMANTHKLSSAASLQHDTSSHRGHHAAYSRYAYAPHQSVGFDSSTFGGHSNRHGVASAFRGGAQRDANYLHHLSMIGYDEYGDVFYHDSNQAKAPYAYHYRGLYGTAKSFPLSMKHRLLYKSMYDSFEKYSLCKIVIPNVLFLQ